MAIEVDEKKELTLEEIEEKIKKETEAHNKELEHLKGLKNEILKKKNDELKAKKAERQKEVDEALKHYVELRDEFAHDYGYYIYSTNDVKPRHLDFMDYLFN